MKWSQFILLLAGGLDIIRGIAHTFWVRWAASTKAGIDTTSDHLVLMSAFGVSNFLSAFLYFLILWKSRNLAPYILLLIPFSYLLGGLGMKLQEVQLESPFVGQYMMRVYLTVCLISGLMYFLSVMTTRETKAAQ